MGLEQGNPLRLFEGDMIGGRYRVLHPIGQGGMGIVYAVRDLKLDGIIRAMKITAGRPGTHAYSEEASMLMKLNHPCLPHITDYFPPDDENGFEAFVMDYVDGYTLSSIVEESLMTLTISTVTTIGLQLCSAFLYLHHQPTPIIHRDLKPSNVMFDRNGHVKLIDFGISRRFKEGQAADTVQLGTLGFAAPEQQEGKQSDARTDIYSLGALFYYLATQGSILSQEMRSATSSVRMNGMPKGIPASFRSLMERMLQPNPNYRFQSMREVEHELKAAAVGYAKASSYENSAVEDGNPPGYGGSRGRQEVRISVLSLSPGAGATWMTLTSAFHLAKQGYSITAAEYYKLSPEWKELLPDESALPADTLQWLPVSSGHAEDIKRREQYFTEGLLHAGTQIQIVDFSHAWLEAEALSWIKQSQVVFVICDPFIAKWQPERAKALLELDNQLRSNGRELHWIANKDMKFRKRAEWLSMLPRKPLTSIPMLPQEEMLNMIWKRRWMTEHPRFGKQIERSLTAVSELVGRSFLRR